MEPLRVHRDLVIPPDELRVDFALSGGPGGQNVNKTATRVTLRFSVTGSRVLDERTRARLNQKLAGRLTRAGDLVVRSTRHREQRRNIVDARARLAALLAAALAPDPPKRVATRPTRGSVRRRLDAKRRRSEAKRRRQRPTGE